MPATLTQRTRVELIERVANTGSTGRIDREAGVIYGVRVLGFKSQNGGGREYTREAMRRAIGLYEGVEVNIDHPTKKDVNGNRPFMDVFGCLKNVRLDESRGLVADLHYIKSHPLAESVLERVERFPGNFGLSHVAVGDLQTRGGRAVVESIDEVKSVDLVRNPATGGLFESAASLTPSYPSRGAGAMAAFCREGRQPGQPLIEAIEGEYEPGDGSGTPDTPADLRQSAIAAFEDAIAKVSRDTSLTKAQKLKRIGELLDEQERFLRVLDKQQEQDRRRDADTEPVAESRELRPWQSHERLLLSANRRREALAESRRQRSQAPHGDGSYNFQTSNAERFARQIS